MMPVLSVLIATMPSRRQQFERMHAELRRQIVLNDMVHYVEVVAESDDGTLAIGAKRNIMVEKATGRFVCHVDDDDAVAIDFIRTLVMACRPLDVDCVTYDTYSWKLAPRPHWRRTHYELRYKDYTGWNGEYQRPPGWRCAIRHDIALGFPFPDWRNREDTQQCLDMARAGALKSERHIDRVLYVWFPHDKAIPPERLKGYAPWPSERSSPE
jgi:hypothetical protein